MRVPGGHTFSNLSSQLQRGENEVVNDLLFIRLKIGQQPGDPVGDVVRIFLFAAGYVGKKLFDRNAKADRDLHDALYRRILFSALQMSDIGGVQVAFFRQRFLAQLLLLAKAPDPAADDLADIFHISVDSPGFRNVPPPSARSCPGCPVSKKEQNSINIHYKYSKAISIYYGQYLLQKKDYRR